jgi:DUF1365 family protein
VVTAPVATPVPAPVVDVVTPALYETRITHIRRYPKRHSFRYGSFMWLVDIDSPPRLGWPWRPLARFDQRDHLDIRAMLADRGVVADRILMLTNARVMGYVFNPISVYWCYRADKSLTAIIAEVHNTYGQRHAYFLPPQPDRRLSVQKELYVSPFHPRFGIYEVRVSQPQATVSMAVTLDSGEGAAFVATLIGRQASATVPNLLRMFCRYPWTPLRVSALIRWQAIRLRCLGLRVWPR